MDISKLTNEELEQLNVVIGEMRVAYDRLCTGSSLLHEYTKEDISSGVEGLAMFAKNIMQVEEKLVIIYEQRIEIQKEVERVLRLTKIQAIEKRSKDKKSEQVKKKES